MVKKHCTSSTDPLSSSLFVPRTEEDLLRDIISLSSELKYARDLPHALISFHEERLDALTFNIVLLRVLKPGTQGHEIDELSKHLPATVRLIPKQVAVVGTLQGKYHKEASLFALEVERAPFARENHSVDLIKARAFIVNSVETIIGPFKDYSASLFTSQNKDVMKSTGSPPQVVRLTLRRAPQSIDPRSGSDRVSGMLIRMLYEGLCRIAPSGEVVPAVASRIVVSDDQLRYTFILKETFWSNGSPLTAHDFEYAWKKGLDPTLLSPYCFQFFPIKNAEAVKRGDLPIDDVGIHSLDDQTLVVDLQYPAPYFLELTAGWVFSPLSQELDQKHPGWAYQSDATHVSNGPFKLESWKPNDEVHLVKNPLFWDAPHVYLDKIQVTVMPSEPAALAQFSRGELDWMGDPLGKLAMSDASGPIQHTGVATDLNFNCMFWLELNTKAPPPSGTP